MYNSHSLPMNVRGLEPICSQIMRMPRGSGKSKSAFSSMFMSAQRC